MPFLPPNQQRHGQSAERNNLPNLQFRETLPKLIPLTNEETERQTLLKTLPRQAVTEWIADNATPIARRRAVD